MEVFGTCGEDASGCECSEALTALDVAGNTLQKHRALGDQLAGRRPRPSCPTRRLFVPPSEPIDLFRRSVSDPKTGWHQRRRRRHGAGSRYREYRAHREGRRSDRSPLPPLPSRTTAPAPRRHARRQVEAEPAPSPLEAATMTSCAVAAPARTRCRPRAPQCRPHVQQRQSHKRARVRPCARCCRPRHRARPVGRPGRAAGRQHRGQAPRAHGARGCGQRRIHAGADRLRRQATGAQPGSTRVPMPLHRN